MTSTRTASHCAWISCTALLHFIRSLPVELGASTRTMWLYRLTNKLTDKQYIGTSVNPVSHRISRHVYAAKTGRDSGMPIASAIKKYGINNFTVDPLVQCDDYEYLLDLEAKAIVAFNTRVPNGYNLTAGGRGTRRPCSPETRALISDRTKGRKPWNFGKRNANTISRYARKDRPRLKPGRKAGTGATSWNAGRPCPEAEKQKIAESMRRVRATRFWSSRKKESNPVLGGK
jgi:group I intron endonuclease